MRHRIPLIKPEMTREELYEQAQFLEKELKIYMKIAERLARTAHILSCTTITLNGCTVVRVSITHKRVMDVVNATIHYNNLMATRDTRWVEFRSRNREKLAKDNKTAPT